MDQDINELMREFRKTNESQEKLLGLFQTMAKRHANSETRGSRGSNYNGFDQEVGDFKKSLKDSGKIDQWLRPSAGAVAASFRMLHKDVTHVSGALAGLTKTFLGVALAGEIIGGIEKYTTGLVSTYKDLADYGQTFSDGIFGMAKAAMNSSMSLEEYARLAKRNSAVMSQMSGRGGGLAELTASVRSVAKKSGQFGYTMSGLNDLVGDYMETQRIQGRLDKITSAEAQENLLDLAADTSALSAVFGKSRKEISEATQAAMRSVSMTLTLGTMSVDQAKKQGPAFERAIAGLASQVGDAGKLFPQFLADTLAFEGREWNSEIGKTIAHVLPSATGAMSELAAKLKNASPDEALDLQNDYVKKFKGEVEKNMSMLKILHEAGGDAGREADQILSMYQGLKVMKPEELKNAKERVKQQENFTRIMSNLEQNWAEFTSSFLSKIFPLFEEPLKAIGKALTDFSSSTAATDLLKSIKSFADLLGAFVSKMMSPQRMSEFSGKISGWLSSFATFIKSIDDTEPVDPMKPKDESKSSIGLVKALTTLKDVVVAVATPFVWIKDVLDKLGISLGEALIGFIVLKKGLGLVGSVLGGLTMLKNIFKMSVSARNVTINGSRISGGGFDGGHGNKKGGRRGGRGWFGKAAAAAGLGVAGFGEEIVEAVTDAVDGKADKAGPTETADGKAGAPDPAKPVTEAPVEGGLKGWFKGLLSGFKGNGLMGGAMHGLGLAGAGVDLYTGATEIKKAADDYMNGGTGADLAKALIQTVVPRAAGWAGAAVGATLGTAGGAWTGPGAVATGFGGGVLGYSAGSAGGDGVAKDLGKLVDYFVKPSPGQSQPPSPTNPPAIVSEAQARDIQTAQVSVIERLQKLEKQAETDDPNAKKMVELIQQLVEMMKEGTGVNAAFLQKVTDTISGGNRRIVSSIVNQGR